MSKLFNQSTSWIVDRRWLTYLVLAVITTIAVIGYRDPELISQLWEEQPVAVADVQSNSSTSTPGNAPPDVETVNFGGEAILVVESDAIFSPAGSKAIRDIVESLKQTDYVESVLWFDDIPVMNLFGLPEPNLPHSTASPQQFAAAREKALSNPFIEGRLLSSDTQTMLLMIDFDPWFIESDDDCIAGLRNIAETAAARHPSVSFEFTVTGGFPIYITAMESHASNQFFYQTVGYCMIAIMAVVLFRGLAAVSVVALAPIVGVFWTMGFVRFLDFQDNPFNDVVLPVLISLVGLTDGVHLMVQIRKLRSEGMTPRAAAKAGIEQVGLACALTSLTTAIGFGSLSLAGHELVRDFGVACVIGVVLVFVAVVTTIPLACSTWIGRYVDVGQSKSLVDKNLTKIGSIVDWVLKRNRAVSYVALAATVACILISLTLRPDERRAGILPTQSEPAIAIRKLDKAMGGLETASVQVRWSENVSEESTEILKVIGEVGELLNAEPLIGHPLSIRELIESMPGDGPVEDRLSMLELLPASLKRSFYTPEYRWAEVSFRVQDLGISKYDSVFRRITDTLAAIQVKHPEFSLSLNGEAVDRWSNIYQIVVDLATSLGTASLIIFAVLALVYRSIRIGLISIVPNLFPLAAAGVYLVITGQALEIVTVCAFTVCLGIAVDDTIHFLTRYQEEKAVCADEATAIRQAFTGVGTALIMTTIVLVSGFTTVLFSDSRDHFTFASMGIITLSVALFTDLVFLPALLARFASSKRERTG